MTAYPPCLPRPYPKVCYVVNTYSGDVELPNTAAGYRLSYQNCCRQNTLNVVADAPSINNIPGATYETILPGTNTLATGNNSNAVMDLKDTALVCHGNPFRLPFSATDSDGDSLSYRFEGAYNSGTIASNQVDSVPGVPP